MNFRHILSLILILAVGFYVGKKYPTLLAGVPLLG